MNILRSYKRSLSFLWINIIGLSIGLATSIMLLLFIVNELRYDKHFENAERIIKLSTIMEGQNYDSNRREAYNEIPGKVPGIEAAVQIYNRYTQEIITPSDQRFQNINLYEVDKDFFKIFKTKFIDGTPQNAFPDFNSAVITDKIAKMIFGDEKNAAGEIIIINDKEYIVTGVVESFPLNSHFQIEILISMSEQWINYRGGLEFKTYYLISKGVDVASVSEMIVEEYNRNLEGFSERFQTPVVSYTEKLTDIYLNTKSELSVLGDRGSTTFIWALTAISIFIMLLAITNFVNLFISQSETRMKEIGIRKTNGGGRFDIIQLFVSEIAVIIFISFVIGCFLSFLLTPYFCEIIGKQVELSLLTNPIFILLLILLYIVTVIFTASYPALYLSRFSPLDILGKRLKFTKRRLTVTIVVFQSVVTIVFLAFVMIMNMQTAYLENISVGYNPKNIMTIYPNNALANNWKALKDELTALPQVKEVSGASHIIGVGGSGQSMSSRAERDKEILIDEYRVMPSLCEMFGFELVEGEFFKPDYSEEKQPIILNETAVRILGLEYPVVGQYIYYKGREAQITGVVKDFFFDGFDKKIGPLAFRNNGGIWKTYIRFDENISTTEAYDLILPILKKFDTGYILNPDWSEDIITDRFKKIKDQSTMILISSLLSLLIAMMGLVAIHAYTITRRTKEVAIRKVNGADGTEIYKLLTSDILKWILLAGVLASPVLYFVGTSWLNYYENRISLNISVFIIPILIQFIIAIIITSGVTLKAVMQNPVKSLKTE